MGFGPSQCSQSLAFVGQEVLRSEALPRMRFSFLAWGYSQTSNLWLAQLASLGGVYILSGLLITFSPALALAITRRHRRDWAALTVTTIALVALAFAAQPRSLSNGRPVAVVCVQDESYTFSESLRLLRAALEHPTSPDLVVFPEHTIMETLHPGHPSLQP